MQQYEGKKIITNTLWNQWKKQAMEGSLLALKNLVLSFRIGCFMKSEEVGGDEKESKEDSKYVIVSSTLMSTIMSFSLSHIIELFNKQVKHKEVREKRKKKLQKRNKLRRKE